MRRKLKMREREIEKREKENFTKTRRSRPQILVKIGVLKNFAIFIGKHLCWSLFLIRDPYTGGFQ